MFFTLCRDLHDLFQKDDLELSFWPNDAEDIGLGQLMSKGAAVCFRIFSATHMLPRSVCVEIVPRTSSDPVQPCQLRVMRQWQGNLSHRREPAACKYGGYDPVADDYEMITMPAEPGDCDEEKNMIQRQIASLSSRIARGGQGMRHMDTHTQKCMQSMICR